MPPLRRLFSSQPAGFQPTVVRPQIDPVVRPLLAFRTYTSSSCRQNGPVISNHTDQLQNSSPPNPRWLSDIKSRLGACISFGCQGPEIDLAGRIAQTIAREWRGLVAGTEGFYIENVPAETEWPDLGPGTNQPSDRRIGNSCVEGARWGDMDSMGHVNNASYLRYAEISRVHYFRRLARYVPTSASSLLGFDDSSPSPTAYLRAWLQLCTPHSIGIIYKRAELDFLLPVTYPDRLTLCHRLADNLPPPGEPINVIPLHVVALSHSKQRNSIRVYEENAVYDYKKQARIAMPQWMVEVLRRAKADEEQNKVLWRKRRAVLEKWVKELEAMTVNSGKAEDMGT